MQSAPIDFAALAVRNAEQVANAAASAKHGAKSANVGLFVRQGESLFAELSDAMHSTAGWDAARSRSPAPAWSARPTSNDAGDQTAT